MTENKTRMGMPVCAWCGEQAIIRVPKPDLHLCAAHFSGFFEDRVAATIQEEGMIKPGDRIALALSGGKDSTALALVLSRLMTAWEDVNFVAITIDEGIAGYRDETVRAACDLTRTLGMEHHTITFRDLYSDELDSLLVGREREACTICGILRKKALSVAAERYGATKVATGHNLNDEAQAVLMNTLRGDLPRLMRDAALENSCFIPRIKPLSYIPEKEIAIYLMTRNFWKILPECPYTRFALRAEVRQMLSQFEHRRTGTMRKLIETKKKIERYCAGAQVSGPVRHCQECGDPCSGDLCQVCRLRNTLKR
jgi:uncharacterized protein (TIGR00269 family)